MEKKYFKYLLIIMATVSVFSIIKSLTEPQKSTETGNYHIKLIKQPLSLEKGLDLQLVGELLKRARNAEEFESLLNSKDTGVNNLDLNGNGRVDYIRVAEFSEGSVRGFKLTAAPEPGVIREIALIAIEKRDDEPDQDARVEIRGNPEIYGKNHHYQAGWGGVGTGLMLGYLFGSLHRPWSSPWSHGYYPPGYQSYPPVSTEAYQRRHATRDPEGAYTRSKQGKYDQLLSSKQLEERRDGEKAPIKESSRTQKAFRPRGRSKSLNSGGFGKFRHNRGSVGRRPARSGGFGRRR